jgi:chromosome segregation ATPase
MSQPTDIEKKSLEAHVELCANRYRFLEQKLETVEDKITGLNVVIREIHDMIQNVTEKRNDQVMSYGAAVIAVLVGIIGFLLARYVLT